MKVEVKTEDFGQTEHVKITADDRCYDTKKYLRELVDTFFEFDHKPRGLVMRLSFKMDEGARMIFQGRYML